VIHKINETLLSKADIKPKLALRHAKQQSTIHGNFACGFAVMDAASIPTFQKRGPCRSLGFARNAGTRR